MTLVRSKQNSGFHSELSIADVVYRKRSENVNCGGIRRESEPFFQRWIHGAQSGIMYACGVKIERISYTVRIR